MRAAFVLARKTWREFRESARVIVVWNGVEISSDPSEFTMSARKWATEYRHLPT